MQIETHESLLCARQFASRRSATHVPSIKARMNRGVSSLHQVIGDPIMLALATCDADPFGDNRMIGEA